jgi:Cu(I)/Ag(I) efflux system membrane protein CusA/SilA
MTVVTTIIGLMPIMLGTGTGSEVMRRIATPMVGGLVSSTILTLVVIPALYAIVQRRRLQSLFNDHAAPSQTGDGQTTDAPALPTSAEPASD